MNLERIQVYTHYIKYYISVVLTIIVQYKK